MVPVRQHLWQILLLEKFLSCEDLPILQSGYPEQKKTLLASCQVYLYCNKQNNDFTTGSWMPAGIFWNPPNGSHQMTDHSQPAFYGLGEPPP